MGHYSFTNVGKIKKNTAIEIFVFITYDVIHGYLIKLIRLVLLNYWNNIYYMRLGRQNLVVSFINVHAVVLTKRSSVTFSHSSVTNLIFKKKKKIEFCFTFFKGKASSTCT